MGTPSVGDRKYRKSTLADYYIISEYRKVDPSLGLSHKHSWVMIGHVLTEAEAITLCE